MIIGSSDTVDYGITQERIGKWKEKREIEKKKYSGILTEPRIIYYSDFFDLKVIIGKRWELFKDILIEKKRFDVLFDEVEMFRNTIAHGRELFPHQKELLAGIVGDLKLKLVIYHNKGMNTDDYFIKILKVSDSLGNTGEWKQESNIAIRAKKNLKVGDEIDILVDAYDPKGRQIKYELTGHHNGNWYRVSSDKNCLKFKAGKEMISQIYGLHISVSTEEADYKNEARANILYSILP